MTSLRSSDRFVDRHIGPREHDIAEMLALLGHTSLDALTSAAVPAAIRLQDGLKIGEGLSEQDALATMTALCAENAQYKSYIGMGYHDTVTPAVLLRNILENPGWYTQYTPYQPEISQGRLQALLNYQTMITDLTGLDIANASMLDEATAAAEAMTLAFGQQKKIKHNKFFVAHDCHPQTIDVMLTRAAPLGIEVLQGDPATFDFGTPVFGALLQYPTTDGRVVDYRGFCAKAHAAGALVAFACDIMALCLLEAPGTLGADIAIGNSQRFGVPLGLGGPHAAFFATKDAYKRAMPGRLIGVSVDATGKPALRLALQTREQHIRRDKATSNICTAQVLLAIISGMYAAWHGPEGLRAIATRIHALTATLVACLKKHGISVRSGLFFDTVRIDVGTAAPAVLAAALAHHINLRDFGDGSVGVALDEATTTADLAALLAVLTGAGATIEQVEAIARQLPDADFGVMKRTSPYLQHPVFASCHSETDMMRYLHRLQSRDLSLTTSMIPLGSCTMKLNAAAEMLPITWSGFGKLHPFAPAAQMQGYLKLFKQLEAWLCEITGFAGCSLQPNAGSQGEYAGMQVIRAWHRSRGDLHRDVCLIPHSAHGTNPASAAMTGMQVVVVACDPAGNIDLADLAAKAAEHEARLAALMVTYPSTHGVFEHGIKDICALIHNHGGQVYMDGANLNAQVGLCRPGDIGADVCHINLHKTFAIPHGGGGPGMGPICCASHLAAFLPGHAVVKTGGSSGISAISAAPWGSASILPISWMYIAMLGGEGLKRATQVAILNANYVARRLSGYFPILYTGQGGLCAHECIVDTRTLKPHVEVDDIAKRLMDFGFHAPTMSFPVPGTLMVEPTESESKAELDRFCDALIAIHAEAASIARGAIDANDNPLKNAPHTAEMVLAAQWTHPYSREEAAFPAPWTRVHKFWPASARIDNVFGDRNLMCSCPPTSAWQ